MKESSSLRWIAIEQSAVGLFAQKDLGWDRGVESKKVVQHVYLVGAKSIYRVAEKIRSI